MQLRSATAEISFSSLLRIKIFLRNSISSQRLDTQVANWFAWPWSMQCSWLCFALTHTRWINYFGHFDLWEHTNVYFSPLAGRPRPTPLSPHSFLPPHLKHSRIYGPDYTDKLTDRQTQLYNCNPWLPKRLGLTNQTTTIRGTAALPCMGNQPRDYYSGTPLTATSVRPGTQVPNEQCVQNNPSIKAIPLYLKVTYFREY